MSKRNSSKSRRKTPWDHSEEKTPMQQFISHQYLSRYYDHHPLLSETGESTLINSYVPFKCPRCESTLFRKKGFTVNGVQRYYCSSCSQSFTPVTNTIFDGHKISISEWIDYTLNIIRYVSINADSWNNRNAITTSRYWLEKLFLILEDYQNTMSFSGRVWLDETFYSVSTKDITRHEDGSKLRGISSNQMCIGVMCDYEKSLCIFEGYGRPSQKKTYEAFKEHIQLGSTLVHDKDHAHKKLIESLSLVSEVYDSKAIKHLSDKENPLDRVNRVHALLKTFLYMHRSFDRDSMQDYLNLFSLVINPPHEPLEKVELLLDLAFQNPKSLRYRDFFRVN